MLLSRTTSDLDRLTVSDETLTLVSVEGEDDVDVLLLLGAEDAVPGDVLAAGLGALASANGVTGSALPVGTSGPGVVVEEIESTRDGNELAVSTVAFDVDASHDLLASAELFGLAAARDTSNGHFPGISPSPLAVGQARQDVTARFTHEGFVAAAVTAVGMVAGSAPPRDVFTVRRITVRLDRPFGFAAVHRPSGLVLVAGWVAAPAAARRSITLTTCRPRLGGRTRGGRRGSRRPTCRRHGSRRSSSRAGHRATRRGRRTSAAVRPTSTGRSRPRPSRPHRRRRHHRARRTAWRHAIRDGRTPSASSTGINRAVRLSVHTTSTVAPLRSSHARSS